MTDFKNVDSDWKARAEADRKKIQEKIEQGKGVPQLPPASFMIILSSYVSQAMIALGEVEVPGGEGRTVDLAAARFLIDCMGVLKEKTQGNLDAQEEKSLEEILQGLRLRYVAKAKEEDEKGKPAILAT